MSLIFIAGLLKEEFKLENGSAVFLSPKCYWMEDQASGQVKKAMKGVNADTPITYEDCLDALYNNTNKLTQQMRLRRHKNNYSMELQSNVKKSLNSVYYKMRVSEDFISCSPHIDNDGKYL